MTLLIHIEFNYQKPVHKAYRHIGLQEQPEQEAAIGRQIKSGTLGNTA
jgi:hypothetical protein